MKDKEHLPPGNSQTSTPRTLRYQQRHQILVQIIERAVSRDPKLGQALAQGMAGALLQDAALAQIFSDTFRKGGRGPLSVLSMSPLITGLENVLNVSGNVLNVAPPAANVLNVSPPGEENVLNVAPVAPAPPPPPAPPPHTPPPPTPSTALTPTGGTMAEPSLRSGRQREPDECFERLADGLFPGIKGDYGKLDRDARGQLNHALAQLRAKMDEQGIPDDKRPGAITYAISRLPNYARNRTPGTLVKNWTACLAGADRDGRDNGLVRTRYFNETGTVKHQPKLNLD